MPCKIAIAALSLIFLFGGPTFAQVKFERKLHEGKSSTLETNAKVEQKLTIAGMDIDSSSDTHSTAKYTTGKRDKEGKVKIEEKLAGLQVQIKAQGSEYLFDSASPDKAGTSSLEILRKIHQVQARRKTTKTYDKDNKLTSIEYDENALNDVEESTRNLVKEQFDPEKVKKAELEEAGQIPATPVSKGESWVHTTKSNLGAGQIFTIATTYTYEGEIEKGGRKLDKITLKVKSVEFSLEDSPLPFTLKSADLKPTESKGEILFDRAAGAIAETTTQMTIKGDIIFVLNGTELPSKLELKMDIGTARK